MERKHGRKKARLLAGSLVLALGMLQSAARAQDGGCKAAHGGGDLGFCQLMDYFETRMSSGTNAERAPALQVAAAFQDAPALMNIWRGYFGDVSGGDVAPGHRDSGRFIGNLRQSDDWRNFLSRSGNDRGLQEMLEQIAELPGLKNALEEEECGGCSVADRAYFASNPFVVAAQMNEAFEFYFKDGNSMEIACGSARLERGRCVSLLRAHCYQNIACRNRMHAELSNAVGGTDNLVDATAVEFCRSDASCSGMGMVEIGETPQVGERGSFRDRNDQRIEAVASEDIAPSPVPDGVAAIDDLQESVAADGYEMTPEERQTLAGLRGNLEEAAEKERTEREQTRENNLDPYLRDLLKAARQHVGHLMERGAPDLPAALRAVNWVERRHGLRVTTRERQFEQARRTTLMGFHAGRVRAADGE